MVSCSECGFMAVRRFGDRVVVEADLAIRDRYFNPPDRTSGNRYSFYDPHPVCWKALCDFTVVRDDTEVLNQIKMDRGNCPGFERWIPGRTPAETQGMLDRQAMIRSEDARDAAMRVREDQRDEAMRAREDKRDADVAGREARRDIVANRRHRTELYVFGGLIAAATLLAAVIQPIIAAWID